MRSHHRLAKAALAACLCLLAGLAQPAPAGSGTGGVAALGSAERRPTVFAPAWDALIGHWLGQGDGRPGSAGGAASFEYELDGRVITRRNVVDFPGPGGKAGVHHEDLMTIYPAPDGRNAEAMYYDNEGHVIHYAATWSSDERTLVMLSFPEDGAPRLRLTYTFEGVNELSLLFEVAPPGSVDFKRFVGGTLVRAGR